MKKSKKMKQIDSLVDTKSDEIPTTVREMTEEEINNPEKELGKKWINKQRYGFSWFFGPENFSNNMRAD